MSWPKSSSYLGWSVGGAGPRHVIVIKPEEKKKRKRKKKKVVTE